MSITRNVRLAGWAFLIWSLAYNLAFPFWPIYAAELGASPWQAGLMVGFGAAGAAVLVFPLSLLADRCGPRAALLTAWSLSALGFFAMVPGQRWSVLIPGAFFATAGLAALPTLNALILDETEPRRTARIFALVYAAGPAGLLAGSAIGGMLAEFYSIRLTLGAAGVLGWAGVAVLWSLDRGGRKPADATPAAPRISVPSVTMLAFCIVAGLGFALLQVPTSFVVPYLLDAGGQSLLSAGLYTAYLAGAQLLWSILFAVWPGPGHRRLRLGRGTSALHLSASTLLGIGLCLAANGIFGLLLPTPWAAAWLLALLLRGSQYTLQSLGSALLGDVVQPGPGRATRITAAGVAIGAGSAVAPLAGGWLYAISTAYPFQLTGVTAALGAVAIFSLATAARAAA